MHGPRKRRRRKRRETAADVASPGQFDETGDVYLSPMSEAIPTHHEHPLAPISISLQPSLGPAAGTGDGTPHSGALLAEAAGRRDEQVAASLRRAHRAGLARNEASGHHYQQVQAADRGRADARFPRLPAWEAH
jgi:hypothetical protein